jgi:hypothetical protein
VPAKAELVELGDRLDFGYLAQVTLDEHPWASRSVSSSSSP